MNRAILKIPAVKDGEVFSVGGVKFIKFPEVNGTVPAVAKDLAFYSRFGKNNDLRSSDVLKKLMDDFLPKIIDDVGSENLCAIKTDLTALDGLKPYGAISSLVSLPTLDFYRANVDIFDKHKINDWWWLATAWSAPPHESADWVSCVAPSGSVFNDLRDYDNGGVRPFLSFNSSIFESSAQ